MTPGEITTILNALERVETKLDTKADKTDIVRLEGKVDKTNGRVTDLERQGIIDLARGTMKGTIWKASLAIVGALTAVAGVVAAFWPA